jgi:fido (protein-threonine AMPylation protein)
VPGAFELSPECDDDPLRTAEEIGRSGGDVLRWLEAVATSAAPRPVDVHLINDIHARWFDSTFPADAGRHRTEFVLNRKGTAVAVDAILPAVAQACGNWVWRGEYAAPDNDAELVEFVVAEANTLTVRVYDVHPYIDGNTRTTWHLRNYLLMLGGLRPLVNLNDQVRYEESWWAATAEDHHDLDACVLDELAMQDR